MLDNLQSLRAFAAINVVFFHILGTASAYGFQPKQLWFLEGWGASGVDIFFVISGFVMLHTQMQKKRDVLSFIKARLIRVVPIYWIITLGVVVSFFLLPPSAFNSNSPSIEKILQSLFFLSGILSGEFPILAVGWTLEWEMLFYVIFGISLLFSRWILSVFFILLVLIACAFITSNLIVFEFIFGILVAYIFKTLKIQKGIGFIILTIGFLGLAASIQLDFEKNFRVFVWGIPSIIIVMGSVYAKQYSNRLLRLLGDASYSIYLVHFPIVSVFYKLIPRIETSLNVDFIALVCLIACISIGLITHLIIEKPVINLFRPLH